jgi:hypothetical protein
MSKHNRERATNRPRRFSVEEQKAAEVPLTGRYLLNQPSRSPAKELRLGDIRLDGDTQPRGELDTLTVDEYARAMTNGVSFPPAEVVFDGSHYWLWDGFHRYHGRRKAGKETIAVNVTPGTVEDARWPWGRTRRTGCGGRKRTSTEPSSGLWNSVQPLLMPQSQSMLASPERPS